MSLFSRSAFRAIALLVPALSLPASALAQAPTGAQPRSLRLSIATFGGYDSNISTGTATDPEATPSAPYGGAMVSLNYQIRTERFAFSTRGAADSRHYRADAPIDAVSYNGSVLFGAEVTPRLNVNASVNSRYSPRFLFSLLPIAGDIGPDIAPPPLDYAVSDQKVVSYATGGNAVLRVSRRSSLNVAVSTGTQTLLDNNYDMTTRSYGGGYSYSVTRYASLRVGYRESITDYPAFGITQPRRYAQRSFDAGINYSRPLSTSRRTTVSFGSGSSAIDNGQETFYTITGNASLSHQIGRSWETNLVYSRGLGVVAGFPEPFFADAVNANLRGRLTNTLTMLTTTGFANGNVGLGSNADNFASFQATTRLEKVVKRERIGLYGDYFYYGYRLGNATSPIAAIPRRVNRHGVRVGLIFRFPLIQERTPRVTR
jgi:hypothetical protein